MTLWVPPVGFMSRETNMTTPSAAWGTLVTAGGSSHAKNTTYAQIIASTAFDAYGILIMFSAVNSAGNATSMLVDIAIGAAASETVIIPNLNAGYANVISASGGDVPGQQYFFPIKIPAGSRLSATSQALIVSDTCRVAVWLYGDPTGPVWAGTQVVDYGTNTAASKGVDVVAGLSAAEGSWTEIVASTTQDHAFIAAGCGGAADTTVLAAIAHLDLGIGAATETAIVENLPFITHASEGIVYPTPHYAQHLVASGTRLAARISIDNASAQSYDCIMYGVS